MTAVPTFDEQDERTISGGISEERIQKIANSFRENPKKEE